ncbi:AMP-binding protein, partial [Bdellovibrionota bacterium]
VKAGCVVVSVADSLAPEEVATRLRISEAKAIFTQDHILRGKKELPLYAKVIEANPPTTIVLPCGETLSVTLRDEDISWENFLSDNDQFETVTCEPEDHTNILFSSGTTGDPKAIPWNHTTSIKCAMDGYFHHDIHEGDVVAWPTNLGWMMGPWLIYASLINNATIALYYDMPTDRYFGEFVQNAKITMLGLIPSIVKVWKFSDCMKGLDWGHIKAFSSTGECSNSEDYLFLMSLAGYRPIVEYCGGTEIGGGYISQTLVQPASPSTFSTSSLGLNLFILDENGKPAKTGELFIVPPSIGLSTELLNRDHYEVYFKDTPKGPNRETLRRHGDEWEALGSGYFKGQGRADDTMNLGGIKISSTEIERTVNRLENITETAAIAITPKGGGPEQLVIYTVLKPNTNAEKETLKKSMQKEIKEHLNPLFKIHDIVLVDTLPRTASNKVMRRVLRSKYTNPNL